MSFGLIQYESLSKNKALTEEWVMNMPNVGFFSIDYQGMVYWNYNKDCLNAWPQAELETQN